MKLFQSTNTRVYSALLGIDTYGNSANKCPGKEIFLDGPGKQKQTFNWRSNYKSFLQAKIPSQNALISSAASSFSAAVPTASSDQASLTRILSTFPIASITIPTVTSWPTNQVIPFQKRDGSNDGGENSSAACDAMPEDTDSDDAGGGGADPGGDGGGGRGEEREEEGLD